MRVYVLDDGTRVIDSRSFKEFFDYLTADGRMPQEDATAMARWCLGLVDGEDELDKYTPG